MIKFLKFIIFAGVLSIGSAQNFNRPNTASNASNNKDLVGLFSNAFGGKDGEHLLSRFVNLLSGGRSKDYNSVSLGSFFRDSVFDNLVKKAYELNSEMTNLQKQSRDFAMDMERIRRIIDVGGSPDQVISVLKRRENLPGTVNKVFYQNNMVKDLSQNFTKFIGAMRALRAAFSNEEGIGDTLKELITEAGSADVPRAATANNVQIGEVFSRFLRVLKGEGLDDLSFQDFGLCSSRDQCQKMQRGLQDLKRIFDMFSTKNGTELASKRGYVKPGPDAVTLPRGSPQRPTILPTRPRTGVSEQQTSSENQKQGEPATGRKLGQQKLTDVNADTYYDFY